MWKEINLSRQKNFFSSYHGLMYFLQKIPFLGRLFDNAHKWVYSLGEIASAISLILSFFTSILKKGFYLIIMFVFFYTIFTNIGMDSFLDKPISIMYIQSIIIFLGIFRDLAYFYSNSGEAYMFIKVLRLDPRDYYLGNYLYEIFTHLITYSLALFLINISMFDYADLGLGFIDIFFIVVFVTSIRYLLAYASIKIKIDEKYYGKIIWLPFILNLILIITSIVLVPTNNVIDFSVLYNWKFGLIGLIIFIAVTYLLIKNYTINSIVYKILKAKDFDTSEIDGELLSGTKVKSDDLVSTDKDFSRYNGIVYINKIFFDRYKKALFKKALLGNTIKIALLVIALLALIFFKSSIVITDEEYISAKIYIPYFALGAGYLLFNGSFFTKFLYHNMDKKLMKYSYYRAPNNLVTGIKIRLIELLKRNLLTFILFVINLYLLSNLLQFNLHDKVRTLAFALLGMVFFSFFYIFVYYISQPYTNDGKVNNPILTWIPWAVYMSLIYAGNLGDPNTVLNIIAIICILSLILGPILVYKFGPTKFKAK